MARGPSGGGRLAAGRAGASVGGGPGPGTIPELVGVDGLELQLEAGGEWQKETLDIDPFCVPELDRHCLLADLLNPRSCDD